MPLVGSLGRPAIYLFALAALTVAAYTQTAAPRPPQTRLAPRPTNAHVDSRQCETCHADIARTYRQTGMGRAFYRYTPQTATEAPLDQPFHHEASDTYFSILQRAGKYFQRRWQTGFDGKETNVEEKSIDFVMGSGNHARTYLHLTPRNTLQQLPLGWYAEKGGYWGMNPGYDRPDYKGSSRVIHYECMFCHNAYPRIPAANQEAGAEAQYLPPLPEGIDCQRCHGPGERHIRAVQEPGATPEKIRAAIVNPARLTAERELEVCMQCHLETTSRRLPHSVLRLDRGPFSYIPGQPLGDFRLAFDRTAGQNQDVEIAGASAYRLRQSQCFLKSEGRLRCTTCHNPHDIARGTAAATASNKACIGCHTATLGRVAAHNAAADCSGCHMPRRRTDDVVHVVMTDHQIVRRPPPGDLLAEKAERHETPATSYQGEVVPYYPQKLAATPNDELHAALAQVLEAANLAEGLPRLAGLIDKHRPALAAWYTGLGEAYRASGDLVKAIPRFEEAARRAPASQIVQLQLGNALMEAGEWAKAEAAFRKAKTLKPNDPSAWGLLGWTLWQQNLPAKRVEARTSLEAGLKLDPESADLHNHLGALLMGSGDASGAEREFRAALKIDPGAAEWHSNFGGLLASRGATAESRFHFERALLIDPNNASARLNYAKLFAASSDFAEAERQAQYAVEVDPNLAAAHELLGQLLNLRRDSEGALRELETAIRLKPDSVRARYELAVLLWQSGNTAGALEHFTIAAKASDPQVKAAATEMLRRLGR
ncbi:MAG: tetratricopeptide repeat protein [Candidatus Solibacter sp.]